MDETYFQPISYHIGAYEANAGSLLTTHGAAAPTLSGFKCPDMDNSGSNTYICQFAHYNSQGETDVSWSANTGHTAGGTLLYGTCLTHQTVAVSLSVTNPYGSKNEYITFSCPTGPIP